MHAAMSGSGTVVSLETLKKFRRSLHAASCADYGRDHPHYDEAAFVWIDALDPADSEFATLQERFDLPRLAVKDSMSPRKCREWMSTRTRFSWC